MEQKKEDRFKMVRCIDPKNNTVRNIPAHAVQECVKTYGLVVQDYEEKPEEIKSAGVSQVLVTQPENVESINELTDFDGAQEESLRDKYFRLFGKKAGNKTDANILKEIEEFENTNL